MGWVCGDYDGLGVCGGYDGLGLWWLRSVECVMFTICWLCGYDVLGV